MAPNFPPGTPNLVDLTFTPTWLFTPTTSAPNNVQLHNFGKNIIYVGQADVTFQTGLPLPPASRPVRLVNVLSSLYAVSQPYVGALLGTVQTAATAGTTSLTFSSTVPSANLPVGTQFLIGSTTSTSNQEVLSVAGSTNTSVLTTSTATAFAHDTTNVVYACVPTYGQVSVRAGVF